MQSLHHQLALNLNTHVSSMLNIENKFYELFIGYVKENKSLPNLMTSSLNNDIIEIDMPYFGEKITSSSRFSFNEDKMPVIFINFHDNSRNNVAHLELDTSGKINIGGHAFDYDQEKLPSIIIDIIMMKIFLSLKN
ncbi:hypothetical protein [Serratia marcescens]|uniref:hypothetical protein n=1 Tax=Serratia marcescens TaxID=615 RepID=UPI003159D90B